MDDFAGSASQAQRVRNEVVEALTALDRDWFEKILVVIGVGIVHDLKQLKSLESKGVETAYGLRVPANLMPLSPDGGVFDADEIPRARDFLETIGKQLQPDAPLGYGDDPLLICFAENCPNNTLPIFWSHGEVGRRKWRPLLART